MIPPPEFVWNESWEPITDEAVASSLLTELTREVCQKHRIFQRAIRALARRVDCDDVLFLTNDAERPLAVVHLTWRGQEESDPTWPITELFADWNEFGISSGR
jgi:hypothetical protein